MKPRDEISTIVAGQVIAETFTLIGTDGTEYGNFDSTPPDYDPSVGSLNPRGAIELIHSPPAYLSQPGVTRARRSTIEWSGPTEDNGQDTVGKGPSELRLTTTRTEDTADDYATTALLQEYAGAGYRSNLAKLEVLNLGRSADIQMLADSSGSAVATVSASGAAGLAFVKVDGAAGRVEVRGEFSHMPAGTIISGIWTSAPAGFLLLNGGAYANANTIYPNLWAVAPAGWKSGTTLIVPNMSNRVLQHDNGTPGTLAGSNTHTLTISQMPQHQHGVNHTHGMTHTHQSPHGTNAGSQSPLGAGNSWAFPGGATKPQTGGSSAVTTGGASNTFSAFEGGSSSVDHTPAHMTVRMAIKT